ncbi:hypothetical protein H5P28_13265 [Ruficoccus amylovorans]|uniref:Ice-binding protein C-terminal domain-containing protein n=1 Tax=Ruficoccus amylovorans TaxID=1804625 RepID=A0A842HJ94_9BACT|nr:hypothetical protein [Ruficoccus amylovorans]MBC2595231.1 hypothetical protein [Ruficoccus amylovorans]
MRRLSTLILVLVLSQTATQAATLDMIPGPDDTGGMVMPLVYLNMEQQSVTIDGSQGTLIPMYSLQDYEVWGAYPFSDTVFNPSQSEQEWYDLLDPTRQNLPFSTRYGFEVISGNASSLPAGSYVYIKATSIDEGLKIYDVGYWADVWQHEGDPGTWIQVFGEGNFGSAYGLDNIAAWGDASTIKMWHPVVVSTRTGLLSATFEIYVGDGYANPLEGWTSDTTTLSWEVPVVPEPSTQVALLAALAVLGPVLGSRRRVRFRTGHAR